MYPKLAREILQREAIMNRSRGTCSADHISWFVWLMLAVMCALLASPTHGMVDQDHASALYAKDRYAHAKPVKMIQLQQPVHTWHALDLRRVILRFDPEQNYLLTLTRDCHGLTYADHLGVSTSNNAIYAGFDYVSADNNKCAISTISKLAPGN
ncbi:MAG: DUF6491 family protein [Pseudomonadota bacterium]